MAKIGRDWSEQRVMISSYAGISEHTKLCIECVSTISWCRRLRLNVLTSNDWHLLRASEDDLTYRDDHCPH